MSKKNGRFTSEKWVKTKLELARLLGISRPTLDTYSVMPGFPERAANGHFPLEQCRAFVAGQTGRNEEKRALELQRLRDDVSRGQIELARAGGLMMPVKMVSQALAHWAICARNIIQGSDLTDEQKESLTCAFEKIDCTQFMAPISDAGASDEEADD